MEVRVSATYVRLGAGLHGERHAGSLAAPGAASDGADAAGHINGCPLMLRKTVRVTESSGRLCVFGRVLLGDVGARGLEAS